MAVPLQQVGHRPHRPVFAERFLGVGVQVLAERHQLGAVLADECPDRFAQRGRGAVVLGTDRFRLGPARSVAAVIARR